MHISAPAHPSATDGLYLALFMAVFMNLNTVNINLSDYSKPQFSEKKKKNIAMTESKGRITAHGDQWKSNSHYGSTLQSIKTVYFFVQIMLEML